MKLKLTLTMENAAFDLDQTAMCRSEEAARILRELSDRISKLGVITLGETFKLVDVNGNTVGEAKVIR